MVTSAPHPETPWEPLTPTAVAALIGQDDIRWWLSGGVALDRWLGETIRERSNIDISTIPRDLGRLIESLPGRYSAWIASGDTLIAWADADEDTDPQPLWVHDDETGTWVLRVNAEDGSDNAWLYRRDSRLQLPWDRAVVDVEGIPTGAPEVQLVWKALRPRPEDDTDKNAVLPKLSDEAREWYERAILRLHPHSTWAIHVRSPMFPAKASWNRSRR